VDLSHVAREVLAELAPAALARGQSIELEADAAVPVRGSATLLSVLVRNLADNALRYSPDGARVVVSVDHREGRPVLTVDDSGSGLSDAQQQRLGERFFRVLGSGEGGSGLGWSIVRRIADAHAAQLQIGRSAEHGGLAVKVSLPAA
jgi:two-component system sensor histidine kinase QseC